MRVRSCLKGIREADEGKFGSRGQREWRATGVECSAEATVGGALEPVSNASSSSRSASAGSLVSIIKPARLYEGSRKSGCSAPTCLIAWVS